jgi:formate dehydrogenase maturation protein FdhE
LPVFSSAEHQAVRLHACESCGRYLKVIDMTVDGHAVAVVDEIATSPLDLWAAEQGYQKIERNLLGC